MQSRIVKVRDVLGIHVRVACDVIEIARYHNCKVFINKNGETKEMAKPLDIVSAHCVFGEEVEFFCEGENETVEKRVLEDIYRIV